MGTKHRTARLVLLSFLVIGGIAALIAAINAGISSDKANAENPVAGFLYDPNAVVNVSSLNVRTGPDVSYTAVAYLVEGQRVKLVGRNHSATWAQVELENGFHGWVNARYLVTNLPVAGLPVTSVALPGGGAQVTVPILDIRSGPDASFPVVATAYAGDTLWINGRNQEGTWVSVTLPNGVSGWVSTASIQPNVLTHDLVIRPWQPVPVAAVQPTPTATRPPGPPPIGMRPGQERPELQPQPPTPAASQPFYSGPGQVYSVVDSLSRGQVLTLLARTADNQWVLAQLPDGRSGWLPVAQVQLSVPLSMLPLVAADGSFVYPSTSSGNANPTPESTDPGKQPQVTAVPTIGSATAVPTISPTVEVAPPAQPTPAPTSPSGSVLPQFELRSGPGAEFPIVGTVIQGQSVVLLGRNTDGSWLKIRMPDGLEGWVLAVTLRTEIPLDNLPILES